LKDGNLFQRADLWIRHLLPVGMTLILVLVGAVPSHLPGFATVAPMLPLIGIYYWGIYRPDLLPASVAFMIGVINDIIAGMPLGVTPLIYLLVQGMTASQRRFFLGKPFLVSWWCFALVAAGAILVEWALVSMIFDHMLDLSAVFFEFLLTVFSYPLLGWLFARTQLSLMRRA
jgi:rod shape-determining protein MreD